ncbi:thioesterase family protein [Aspergillus luchuensis]|uniref:Thioesterase family protein n=1 Tax=Aspergillus kawachii TaxID=1069201 RepID=A0A146FLE9_ASPKA|nr:thioesterase family protein [Aspergillus luchuensis]
MAPTTPLRTSKMPAPSVRPLSQLTPFEQTVHSYSTGPPTLDKNDEALPVGMEIRLVCELVHMGKRMALLRAEIQKLDGSVCVVAEHDKANTDPADTKI